MVNIYHHIILTILWLIETLPSPGRFFAVNEIKAMFAHILLNYDVQLPNGSMERPPNFTVEGTTVPSRRAKVMFRKRRV